jgi:chromosome segregation ATPase
MRDLENQVQAQADVIQRQAAALEQAENREAVARAANGQLQEDAGEVQQRLQAKLGTAETQLSLVAAELQDARDGAAAVRLDLEREVDATAQLRARVASLERAAQESRRAAAEEASDLKVALAAQQDSNAQLAEESAELADALAAARQAVEVQKQQLDAARAQTTEQKLRVAHLEELVQSAQENLSARADQVADMQRSIALLQERLDAKSDAEAAANRTNTEIQGDVEVLQQKLGDAQSSAARLEEQLTAERANGVRLEEALQANEEQHVKDAHAVKLTILGLQRALMDKVSQADRLALQVEAVAKKSLEFEELIRSAQADAQEARDAANRRTAELSAENSELSVAIDAIQADIKALRDQLARSEERTAQLAAANKDLKTAVQIARDAEAAKAEQAQLLGETLAARAAKEKELQAAVDDKTTALDEARFELREASAKVDHQKGRIGQLEDDVVDAQQQLRERQRVERRLLAQLEAGAPGSTDGASDLGAVTPRALRRKLQDSETSRAEMAARLLEILRREHDNNGPDVP